VLAPSTKDQLRRLVPRGQRATAWLREPLRDAPSSKVLGVGRFDASLAAQLFAARADIVDCRAGNRQANIFSDLAVDGVALNGVYDLILAQQPEAATTEPALMASTLSRALAPGGYMRLLVPRNSAVESALRDVDSLVVHARPVGSLRRLDVTCR
jgi:hypothetical protein